MEEGFVALTKFKEREGNCRVPQGHVEGIIKLGTWISNQRASREIMPAERRQQLEKIGLVWDPFGIDWEQGFAALTAFKMREGHCRVRHFHIEGTFKLGQWVGVQRRKRSTMLAERKERLNKIGFVWRAEK